MFVTISFGGFDTDVLSQWNDFKVRYGKSYASVTEEKKRFEAFINNLERLSAFKKTASSSAQYGVTKFFVFSAPRQPYAIFSNPTTVRICPERNSPNDICIR